MNFGNEGLDVGRPLTSYFYELNAIESYEDY